MNVPPDIFEAARLRMADRPSLFAFDGFDLDEDEQHLCEYFVRLQNIFAKANEEFAYVFAAWRELEQIRQAVAAEFDAMVLIAYEHMMANFKKPSLGEVGRLSLPLVSTPGLAAGELREQSALLRAESAAGSLMLMMDDAVQRLRRSVWNEQSRSPYPSDFTLGEIPHRRGHVATAIYAACNAYRHAKDWDGLVDEHGRANEQHPQFRDARRTLEILSPLVGLKSVAAGSVCVDVLRVLSLNESAVPDIGVLWDGSLTDVGRDFAQRYCKQPEAYKRTEEALQYQSSVLSIETSYTMNPMLFETIAEDEDEDEHEDQDEDEAGWCPR